MPKHQQATVYDAVIDIAQDYLGPAAGRFIDRSISSHLHIDPSQLQPSQLPELIGWIRVSVAVLTEDTALVSEFTARIESLYRRNDEQSGPSVSQGGTA